MFLYQTALGGIATVSVTHNLGCTDRPYAQNLALHVQDNEIEVLARRQILEHALQKPIQWLNQVHGIKTHLASLNCGIAPVADAAVTAHRTIALAVMTADCLPVVISAQNSSGQHAVGIAHAGWRGLLNGVIDETIKALKIIVPNAQFDAHLGPCIGLSQFEVGHEVRAAFLSKTKQTELHFYAKSTQKYLCDLLGLARDELYAHDITNITDGGWCTASDPRLASYRRQSVTGRFATLVSLN